MPNGNGTAVKITRTDLTLPKTAAILYSDVKREYFPTEAQYLTEKDALKDAKMIAGYIEQMGIKTFLYPANESLPEKLYKDKPQAVFNLVGSVRGNEYLTSTIPGVLELLDIPYIGAGILGESLSYNKFLVKKLLQQHGIPLPNYQLFNTPFDPLDPTLRFPLISKLNEIHGAVEITKDSISENEKALRERIKFLIQTYDQPAIVEEFIVGREITICVLEGLNKKVYMGEKIIKKKTGNYTFASFEIQWLDSDESAITYQKYSDPVLKEYARKSYNIMKMADYGKFDVRVDSSGRYHFIDVNTNPYLAPKECGSAITHILELYGIPFQGILERLLINTMRDAEVKQTNSISLAL